MNLADVMDDVADRLGTITGLRVWAWPGGAVTSPAAVVTYPSEYRYDETYGRGMDRMTLQVVVLVANPTARPTRDALGAYVDGSGASSVKAVLEGGTYTAFHSLRVVSVDFDMYEVAATKYAAAIFDIDIAGSGS